MRPATVTEVLGRYLVDERLGDGGMANVFRARVVGVGGFARQVAIKRIRADVRRDPAFDEMFIAEAKILAGLHHANIVSVLDFDRDSRGRPYLVMELVEGQDLDRLLASGPIPYSTVIYVIAELLRGLGYAHNLPARAVVQLLALAHAVERATEDGEATRAQIARCLGLTRARMTQICKLVFLAPDIQEEIVASVTSLRITERSLRPALGEVDWTRRRAAWRDLRDRARDLRQR